MKVCERFGTDTDRVLRQIIIGHALRNTRGLLANVRPQYCCSAFLALLWQSQIWIRLDIPDDSWYVRTLSFGSEPPRGKTVTVTRTGTCAGAASGWRNAKERACEPSHDADVAGASPVTMQMWQG